jgi:hypothetical protein
MKISSDWSLTKDPSYTSLYEYSHTLGIQFHLLIIKVEIGISLKKFRCSRLGYGEVYACQKEKFIFFYWSYQSFSCSHFCNPISWMVKSAKKRTLQFKCSFPESWFRWRFGDFDDLCRGTIWVVGWFAELLIWLIYLSCDGYKYPPSPFAGQVNGPYLP